MLLAGLVIQLPGQTTEADRKEFGALKAGPPLPKRFLQVSCKCQSSLLTLLGRAGKGGPCRASCESCILGRCITS